MLIVQSGGGKMHFRGTVTEPATVTVGGKPASVDAAGNFDGVADVTLGSNTMPVVATDGSGNSKTNNYQVTVSAGASQTLSYDADGNLRADGTKTYEWDAANRLTAINYNGASNRSEFTYDGLGRQTKIVEKTGSTINSTKKFVWDGLTIAEERDGSNQVTRRHYPQGVQFVSYNPNTSTPYFYMRDHLGSVREMTDTNGIIQARYDYDPWGNRSKLSGALDADCGFTGHYYHAQSNLYLAPYRGYDSTIARWLSRDPIAEKGGINLYGYVHNNPTDLIDPLGLDALIIVTRPSGNRAGPSTVSVFQNGIPVGQFVGNQNGYIPNGRGGPLPSGDYVLLPKPESEMYPLTDPRRQTEFPLNTPSITRPENATPGPDYEPGRVADDWSNVRIHGEGPKGIPDSNGCLTAPDRWPQIIQDLVISNLQFGGTRIIFQ